MCTLCLRARFASSFVMAFADVDGGVSFVGSVRRPSAAPEECAAWFARLVPEAPIPSSEMSLSELSAFSDALQAKKISLEGELRRLGWVQSWVLRFCKRAHGRELAVFFGQCPERDVGAGADEALETSFAAGFVAPPDEELPAPASLAGGASRESAVAEPSSLPASSGGPAARSPTAPRPAAASGCSASSPRPSPAASAGRRSRSRGSAAFRVGGPGVPDAAPGVGGGGLPKKCPPNRCQRCHNMARGVAPSFPHTHGAGGRACDSQRKCTPRKPAGALVAGGAASSGSRAAPVSCSARSRSSSSSSSGSPAA